MILYIVETRNSKYVILGVDEEYVKMKFSRNYPSEKIRNIYIAEKDVYQIVD